ncbi:MAG TPA: NAD-dependent deacylase [Anaerolineae bacterium]|nr:NAD-dependent deacylase [Anaerolineae bacterium]HID84811.1 NAD-dependent deacylase [Anaerolineales bacterium]HIQ09619.1 NAD-dependent deacylase [Anaerolineaceae bacterium]
MNAFPFADSLDDLIREAAAYIRHARYGVVLTGAGISTPSGIPDFRSTGSGLWDKYDPFEVASLNAFRHHPERFFEWVRPLTREMMNAQPNPAHYAIAQLEQAGYFKTIITQNIDGLHQRAGSKQVIEVHGTLNTATCTRCFRTYPKETFLEAFLQSGEIPRCPECGGILKPDVVLFGEQLPWKAWSAAEKAARQCDLMFVAGSSLEVTPVANLPLIAVQSGAALIIVNHTPTYIDIRADVVLRGDVANIIPRIAQAVLQSENA